jgi:hypothetical protein
VTALRAVVQTLFFTFGLIVFGLPGALAGQAVAAVLVYPALVWLARLNGVWDPVHDIGFAVLGLGVIGAALAWHAPAILPLLP